MFNKPSVKHDGPAAVAEFRRRLDTIIADAQYANGGTREIIDILEGRAMALRSMFAATAPVDAKF